MRSKFLSKSNLLLLLISLPFIFMTWKFINCDFWNDEIYTLKHFTFVPFATVFTDYHVPNNHIFFNLISKCYLSLLGISELFYLMDYPFIIRIIPFILSFGTLMYVYFTGKKFFNEFTAFAALIILLTTIPFYNYFLQVRGYSASMFFVSMMVFHAMRYESNPSRKDFILIILAVFFAVYTIPLNLYFVFSLAFFYAFFIARAFIKKSKKENTLSERKYSAILIAIIAGTGLSLLFYLPVFKEVFFNEYVKSKGWFGGSSLKMLFDVAGAFVSLRYILIILFIIGLVFLFRQRKVTEAIIARKILLLSTICILPFVIAFVRDDKPWINPFIIIFPMFALLMTIAINYLVNAVEYLRKHRSAVVLILFIYCTATFAFGFNNNQQKICNNIDDSVREQTICRNYYFSCYQPNKLAKEYSKLIQSDHAPLIIYDSDYHGMRAYLDKYELKYSDASALEETFLKMKSAYVLTILPVSFEKKMKEDFPSIKIENKNPFKDFHNLFYCEKNE